MKKLTTIIVLIAGILIVSICNFNTVREAFELNTRNAAVDSKVINKENKYIKSELKIPKLVMNNKEIERILNKKFESDIMNFYNTSVKEAESYFDDFPDAENKFVISSDLTSGGIFTLKDLFNENSNYKVVIEDEIKKQIIQLNKEQNLPKNSTQLYAFNEIKDNQKFYIADDTIVIFFDLYDIAPYVAGIPEFPINKEIISNLLNNQYKEIIFFKE